MKIIDTTLSRFNHLQQAHPVLGFPLAVIKKYSDDNGSYHAALLTYYGFLSLFPLLLVVVTVLNIWFNNNPDIQHTISGNINNYFPILGNQLQSNIRSMTSTGLGLAVGLMVTLYGARGVADVLRFTLDSMWHISRIKRAGFPKNIFKSMSVIGVAALGFAATVAASLLTSTLGHAGWVKLLAQLLGFAILAVSLTFLLHVAASQKIAIKKLVVGGLVAAAGIQLLATFGGIILKAQLRNLNSLYGTFAIVLGLLFWIYLLAQVLVYAIEIGTVRSLKLWPRSLNPHEHTPADKQAHALFAKAQRIGNNQGK